MKLTESLLRKIVDFLILREEYDPVKAEEEFKNLSMVASYGQLNKSLDNLTSNISYKNRLKSEPREESRRNIKKVWNEKVYKDPSNKAGGDFLTKKVLYIHKIGAYNRVQKDNKYSLSILNWFSSNPGALNKVKDEISVFAYTPQELPEFIKGPPLKDSSFAILDGRLTFFLRRDAATELTSTATPEIKKHYQSSGLRKKTDLYFLNQVEENFVIDEETFNKRDKTYHEAILGHWKVKEFYMNKKSIPWAIKNINNFDFKEALNLAKNLESALSISAPPPPGDISYDPLTKALKTLYGDRDPDEITAYQEIKIFNQFMSQNTDLSVKIIDENAKAYEVEKFIPSKDSEKMKMVEELILTMERILEYFYVIPAPPVKNGRTSMIPKDKRISVFKIEDTWGPRSIGEYLSGSPYWLLTHLKK